MPSKNAIKTYQADSYYHLYNRGVAKLPIFKTEIDFKVLLSYCKEYLSPTPVVQAAPISPSRQHQNYHQQIKLIAYCLMPNHFHFLIHQKSATSISQFMRSLFTRYTMYFNQAHKRVGPLFQGRYKGVLIDKDEYLLQVSKYIHRNPLSLYPKLEDYPYTSYKNYLQIINQSWIDPQPILSYFSKQSPSVDYQQFTQESATNPTSVLPHDCFQLLHADSQPVPTRTDLEASITI